MIDKTNKTLETISIKATSWIGSPPSLVLHTTFFVGIFILGLFGFAFDKILLILTTVVSLEAIYLSIFIQMTINRNTRRLNEVRKDIDDIQENIEDIQENVEEISEDVEEISEDIEEIQEDVDDIQKDVEGISEDVDDIQKDVEEISEDVEDIQEDVAEEEKIEATETDKFKQIESLLIKLSLDIEEIKKK